MTERADDRPLHPSFFEGRVLVDILSWEWGFSLGVSRIGPRKYRFQGGLDRVRTIKLKGRIQAPQEHRGRDVQVYVYPFDSKMRFSLRGLQSVGSLHLFRSAPAPRDYEASLMLPEAVGCQACRSGYAGRAGIYELLVATPRLKDLIRTRASIPQLVELACEGGMRLLRQDAIDKVLQGVLDLSAARAASS